MPIGMEQIIVHGQTQYQLQVSVLLDVPQTETV